ncbi:hypothetical protein [Sporolactobacillus sp. THM19-2]|uniref:hypothetical protein n=1 Tax=Sporolactobacillus sp. THM19-2 TaxID=2511171 RepID=UPI0010214864|nr:hypothetical protein [Sporolactobacillus sp. THM19-2]RYL92241.1 hypothetical protein EWH91_08420 [Sporolactobacillus sp. THM19-2]
MFKRLPDLPFLCFIGFCYTFTCLVLIPLTVWGWRVFFPLLILLLVQGGVIRVILNKREIRLSLVLTLSTLSAGAAYFLFSFTLTASCLVILLFTSLSMSALEKRTSHFLWRLFLISAVVSVFYYLFLTFPNSSFLFLLLLTELLLLTAFIITEQRKAIRFLPGMTLLFLFGMGVLTGIILLLKPVIVWIYDFIFNFFFKNILYAIADGLNTLLNSLTRADTGARIQEAFHGSNASDQMNERADKMSQIPPYQDYSFLIGACIIAAVILILILLFKKRRIHLTGAIMPARVQSVISPRHPDKKNRRRRFGRLIPPKNPVRKNIFQLQKLAAKHHCTRYSSESLSEWFQRIGLYSQGLPLITGYQKVRYGRQALSPCETKAFFQSLQHIRHLIREKEVSRDKTAHND